MSRFTTVAVTMQSLSLTAMEEASRQGLRDADFDHLLLALTVSDQAAGQVLRSLGVHLEPARAAVAAQHAAQLESLGISAPLVDPGPIVFHETTGYNWTKRAEELFRQANSKGRCGDATAVLRLLLTEPSGLISSILQRLNVAPDEITARLDEIEGLAARPTAAHSRSRVGRAESFVPAPVDEVWALISDPARIPEWDSLIARIEGADADADASVGAKWTATARTHRADGKEVKIKPEMRTLGVELAEREDRDRISWVFSFPNKPNANDRWVTFAIEPAAGGTHLQVSAAWRLPDSATLPGWKRAVRPIARFVMSPLLRFALWMQAWILGNSVSRIFRS